MPAGFTPFSTVALAMTPRSRRDCDPYGNPFSTTHLQNCLFLLRGFVSRRGLRLLLRRNRSHRSRLRTSSDSAWRHCRRSVSLFEWHYLSLAHFLTSMTFLITNTIVQTRPVTNNRLAVQVQASTKIVQGRFRCLSNAVSSLSR